VKKLNWPRIVKTKLLPALPRFSAQGRLLYETPVGDILHAFEIEVSSFTNRAAYVECFVLPLYLPQSYISFDFGKRLIDPVTGSTRWDVTADENGALARMADVIREDGLAFLAQVRTPSAFLQHLGTTFGSLDNPHTLEALAYTQLIADQPERAGDTLKKLQGSLDLSIDWERGAHERVSLISALVATGDLESVRNQLATWRGRSMESLKIA